MFPVFQVVQHLSDEFKKMVRERQNILDRARGRLQYQRELSRLQFLHTQVPTSGLSVRSVFPLLTRASRETPKAALQARETKHGIQF